MMINASTSKIQLTVLLFTETVWWLVLISDSASGARM